MRRAQNADTHALKQHRLSHNSSPVCSSFVLFIASDTHLEPESEKRAKNFDFHTAKNIQIQATLFRFFLDEFFEHELLPVYCSLTTGMLVANQPNKITGSTIHRLTNRQKKDDVNVGVVPQAYPLHSA